MLRLYLLRLYLLWPHACTTGERSYHIFYQLCRSSWAPTLSLGDPEAFSYLAKTGCTSIANVDDAAEMDEVSQALHAMSFSKEATLWIFSLCAAVLHLGNLRFAPAEQGEGSVVERSSHEALSLAARLPHLEPQPLGLILTLTLTLILTLILTLTLQGAPRAGYPRE